jgi:nucleoside-diphosphate-sugar epimerase
METATLERGSRRSAGAQTTAAVAAAQRRAARADPRCSTTLRILVAGASGVLGRATLPHLTGHEVVGLTRSREKLEALGDLGAEPILCDVYDYERLLRVMQRVRPRIVANFLTDLAARSDEANNRIRREGGANLLNAAQATAAGRLVVESVAFALDGDAAQAVAQLEQATCAFAGESVVLRFGRFWGPGTDHRTPPPPPAIQIDEAGAKAARLLVHASPGTHLVTESNGAG